MKLFTLLFALLALALSSCSHDNLPTKNTTANIKDPEKLDMIYATKDLDGEGRLYEVNYTVDYKLDEVIKAQKTSSEALFAYIAGLLYDKDEAKAPQVDFGAGCSTFAVPDAERINFLMGRNYDYRHFTEDKKNYIPTAAILVRTAPEGGKKSISMVDGMHLGLRQGFFTNGQTDLSIMMGLPYAALDGINEDGFAIGILALQEEPTQQNNGFKKISPTVAIRLLLDRVSTVKQAIDTLKHYDMNMKGNGRSNYHFFMADATGDFAIIEYTFPKNESIPRIMEVFQGNDTLRCLTNFYISPTMVGTTDGWGSEHGKMRYWTLRNTLLSKNYSLKSNDAMELLKAVSQPPTMELTSQTQWSSLYDLTNKSLRLTILREYAREFNFKVK